MKCLFIFVAIVVDQIVANPTIQHHHRHTDRSMAPDSERDAFPRRAWWRGSRHEPMPPHGPFGGRHDFGFGDSSGEPGYSGSSHNPHRRPFSWELPSTGASNIREQYLCVKYCPVTAEFNPVCGSNGVTYDNLGRLECEQRCGIEVELSKPDRCSSSEQSSEKPSNTDTPLITENQMACMKSCPITGEYNPVCGSNNVTYSNPGRLECAQYCGVNVTLANKSPCVIPDVISTTENPNKIAELTALCMRSCPVTSEYSPVCGTNNVTYTNPGRLECAQICGVAVTVARRTTCDVPISVEENKSVSNNDTKATTESNLPTTVSSTTMRNDKENNSSGNEPKNCKEELKRLKPPTLEEVMACMQTCSLTSELNPVCGTDSITYTNPGRLLCAQFCGVDVRVKKFAPCGSSNVTTVHCITTCSEPLVTNKPGSITPPLPSVEACMEACPASVEFKPVCGSNNVTYRNLEKLQCARRCGIDVIIKRNVHCSAPEVEPIPKDNATLILECIEQCSVPQKYEPICGSNNVTYNNTGHLICARQCGLDIDVKQSQACSTGTEATSSTTTEKVQTTTRSQNSVNTTTRIDLDVIAQIWATEATKNNDDNEDFGFDQRLGA